MIVLNLKTYEKSFSSAMLYVDAAREIADESGVRIVVCPPSINLKEACAKYDDVFAQHCSSSSLGAHTGSLPAEALEIIGAKGSIVNHSEKKLDFETVKKTIERLHINKLESLVCASSLLEIEKIAHLEPKYLAIEPPELIGTGISVSVAKPELVSESVKKIKKINPKIIPLCGAGVSNKEDVKKALELGSEGVLLASAFVNATHPKGMLRELASVF